MAPAQFGDPAWGMGNPTLPKYVLLVLTDSAAFEIRAVCSTCVRCRGSFAHPVRLTAPEGLTLSKCSCGIRFLFPGPQRKCWMTKPTGSIQLEQSISCRCSPGQLKGKTSNTGLVFFFSGVGGEKKGWLYIKPHLCWRKIPVQLRSGAYDAAVFSNARWVVCQCFHPKSFLESLITKP